jgi:putative Mg2+ transporter-C (MgtC) family protein
MDLLNFSSLMVVSYGESVLRLCLAVMIGVVLGWDREQKGKTIELQAYVIVAVTACLIALLGQEMAFEFNEKGNVASLDLAKVMSGVMTGLGFLGAGALIKKGNDKVVGTATGASIWAAGSIGLAFGFGFYVISFTAFVIIALVLYFGGKLPTN